MLSWAGLGCPTPLKPSVLIILIERIFILRTRALIERLAIHPLYTWHNLFVCRDCIFFNCRCCYFKTPSVVHHINATASAQSPKFLPADNFCQLLRVTPKRSCTFAMINRGRLELATSKTGTDVAMYEGFNLACKTLWWKFRKKMLVTCRRIKDPRNTVAA